MYPNPATNCSVSLVFDEPSLDTVDINIFDIAGRQVKAIISMLNQSEVTVDISSLENGVYIVATTIAGNTQKNTLMVSQ